MLPRFTKFVVLLQPNFIPSPVPLTGKTLFGDMTSPLLSVWLRYCVFATILHSNTKIIDIVKSCVVFKSYVLVNSILPPSPSPLNDLFLLLCSITTWNYSFWEIVVIQSKIEIHEHINSGWHKILKSNCTRGWGCMRM